MLVRTIRLTLAGALAVLLLAGALAPPAEAKTVSRQLGQTATYKHFEVTVGNVIRTEADNTLVFASVCVRRLPPGSTGGKTRVSWDPWRLITTRGTYRPEVHDASHPPYGMFPVSKRVRRGDCVGWWLPFATAKGAVTKITYANSLGNKATWRTPPRSTERTIGSTKRFRHFKVTVTKTRVDADRYWGGAYVKTCVTSRPKGDRGKIRVSVEPWTLSTTKGVSTAKLIMQEGRPDFPGKEYPWSKKISVGSCAEGWIYFPMAFFPDGWQITQVNYRNSLGNQGSWKK